MNCKRRLNISSVNSVLSTRDAVFSMMQMICDCRKIIRSFACFLGIYNKVAVKHDVGIVCFNRRACRHAVLAWSACKTGLQNDRGGLYPGTCALWFLSPAPALQSPPCCRGLCFSGWEWSNKAFLCHCLHTGWRRWFGLLKSITCSGFAL